MPENQISANVNGLAELKQKLDQLPYEVAKAGLKEALLAGGAVLAHEAAALAPVGQTGDLQRSVGEKITIGHDLDSNVVSVGPRYRKSKTGKRSPGVYGLFVEIGTSKMAPQPYLRPALYAAKDRAVAAFVEKLRQGLDKAVQVLKGR